MDHRTSIEGTIDGSFDVACTCGWEATGYEEQEDAETAGEDHQRSPEEN